MDLALIYTIDRPILTSHPPLVLTIIWTYIRDPPSAENTNGIIYQSNEIEKS